MNNNILNPKNNHENLFFANIQKQTKISIKPTFPVCPIVKDGEKVDAKLCIELQGINGKKTKNMNGMYIRNLDLI